MKLSFSEISSKLKGTQYWTYDEKSDYLVTNLTLKSFQDCVDLLNSVTKIANEQNHHPDVRIYNYKFIEIKTRTHDINGITEKDFVFISEVNKLLIKENISNKAAEK